MAASVRGVHGLAVSIADPADEFRPHRMEGTTDAPPGGRSGGAERGSELWRTDISSAARHRPWPRGREHQEVAGEWADEQHAPPAGHRSDDEHQEHTAVPAAAARRARRAAARRRRRGAPADAGPARPADARPWRLARVRNAVKTDSELWVTDPSNDRQRVSAYWAQFRGEWPRTAGNFRGRSGCAGRTDGRHNRRSAGRESGGASNVRSGSSAWP